MAHPRRSQQYRSTRPRRFRARTQPRDYVVEGRTLLLAQTRAIFELEREQRVERAAAAVRHLQGQVDCKREQLAARRQGLGRSYAQETKRLARWLTEDKAALADALWELQQAKRSASRPTAFHVTLELTRLPEPRRWPNALPGGTSRRRASRIEHAIKYAHWEDAAEDAWFCQRYAGPR